MQINDAAHLGYCTNIHAGETWPDTLQSLKEYCIPLKEKLSPDRPFGIGLRLSNESSEELARPEVLTAFHDWLREQNLYVFTINGFPYGAFHDQVVKDKVHHPDWTTPERLSYSKRLFDILAVILPEGLDGGVSTSPISYKFWHKDAAALDQAKSTACQQMMDLVAHLVAIKQKFNKSLHLDIEPEPDGILEDSRGFIEFYQNYLLDKGAESLALQLACNKEMARGFIREHIQLCYDVCHFAVGFESPKKVIDDVLKAGIGIGKIQISAALKAMLPPDNSIRERIKKELSPFNESTYLHQVSMKATDGTISYFPDLQDGLEHIGNKDFQELRTHFHVPLFVEEFGLLQATRQDIVETLAIWGKVAFTNHLEIETYTWEVLPDALKSNLQDSIERELRWVIETIKTSEK
ncbi:MAG: hypothetical protein ACI81P_000897 [Neolewinella sp.]|jgi:hypothetical protein